MVEGYKKQNNSIPVSTNSFAFFLSSVEAGNIDKQQTYALYMNITKKKIKRIQQKISFQFFFNVFENCNVHF